MNDSLGESRSSKYLRPNELVIDDPVTLDGGSTYVRVTHSDGTNDKTVLFEVPYGSVVPPVAIVEPKLQLTIELESGRGTLRIQKIGSHTVKRFRLRNPNTRTVTLGHGDVYGYVNSGRDDMIIRDDSNIPFDEAFEDATTDTTPPINGGNVHSSISSARRQKI